MDLGFGQGDRDTQHAAALVGADADCREHGDITHPAAVAHFLVARVENEILDLAKGAAAPGFQFFVKQLGRAADLCRGEAFDAELAHHRFGIAGRDPLHVHFGHRQHDTRSSDWG